MKSINVKTLKKQNTEYWNCMNVAWKTETFPSKVCVFNYIYLWCVLMPLDGRGIYNTDYAKSDPSQHCIESSRPAVNSLSCRCLLNVSVFSFFIG